MKVKKALFNIRNQHNFTHHIIFQWSCNDVQKQMTFEMAIRKRDK